MAKTGIFCNGKAPTYAHEGDAGADLRATENVILGPGRRALVGTGLRVALPDGVMAHICSRSGLAHKQGVAVLNAPGIIDSGYRGEIKVNLINLGQGDVEILKGDRIAQIVLVPYIKGHFLELDDVNFDSIDKTDRGQGGHGSTGT